MTILLNDLTLPQQVRVDGWRVDVLPSLLDGFQKAQVSEASRLDVRELGEAIFFQFYTSFADAMMAFHREIRGASGKTFSEDLVDESMIQLAATSVFSVPLLFPPLTANQYPAQTKELRSLEADFDTTSPPYTGTPPGSTPTGWNEKQAILDEIDELAGSPNMDDVLDYWQAQEAALLNEVGALEDLVAALRIGEPGRTNAQASLAAAQSALSDVQGLIASHPTPPGGSRTTTLNARVAFIDARLEQIWHPSTGDQKTYRDLRYYWLRRRIGLARGSLRLVKVSEQVLVDLTQQISDIQTEIDFYDERDV